MNKKKVTTSRKTEYVRRFDGWIDVYFPRHCKRCKTDYTQFSRFQTSDEAEAWNPQYPHIPCMTAKELKEQSK